MALNNNGMRERDFSPTVYSKITFSNRESEVDKTKLEFSYWNGLLKVSISPYIPGSEEVDRKASISLHLTVTKAYELLKEIEQFEEDKKNEVNTNFFYGINTNKGLIGIGRGDEFGHPGTTLFTIRRTDENGETISSYAYEFKEGEFYYGIRNFDPNLRTFEKVPHENIEIELLKKHLQEYVNAMIMANGYGSVEALKYYTDNVYKSLNQIKQNLGIKIESKTYGTGSFFRDGGNTGAPKASYSSISDAINPEDNEQQANQDFEDVEVPF